MAKNELEFNVPRIGALIDFNPETPDLTAMLVREHGRIAITVPWMQRDSPYAAWFVGGGIFEDGDAPIRRSAPPKRLLFRDVDGPVLLLNCFTRGYRANVFGPGAGTVLAHYAVLGADGRADLSEVRRMRTRISGLREWLHTSSWSVRLHSQENETSVSITSENAPPILIGNPYFDDTSALTLTLHPEWKYQEDSANDAHHASHTVLAVTSTDDPRGWDAHLEASLALRDLLTLSRWHQESCVVTRVAYSGKNFDGVETDVRDPAWLEVVEADPETSDEHTKSLQHLIQWDDLREDGLRRWFALYRDFRRALAPVISSKRLKEVSATTALAHTMPGLEALAYLLMLRDGKSEKTAARANLWKRFDRILQDIEGCLPIEETAWKQLAIETYNGIKHANRPEPDDVDVLNAWSHSVLIMRAWVAVELGVPKKEVRRRLEEDPQRQTWTRVGA